MGYIYPSETNNQPRDSEMKIKETTVMLIGDQMMAMLAVGGYVTHHTGVMHYACEMIPCLRPFSPQSWDLAERIEDYMNDYYPNWGRVNQNNFNEESEK